MTQRAARSARPGGAGEPEIALVLACGDRPLRLLWFLNSLQQQAPDATRWEAVVALSVDDVRSSNLLETHPLASGSVRAVRVAPGTPPGRSLNVAWRAGRARSVAVLDAELRLPPEWLVNALSLASVAGPNSVVEGATEPDPLESVLTRSLLRFVRSSHPPAQFVPMSNVIYSRDVLERVGGFDERLPRPRLAAIDLAARARREGADWQVAPELIAYATVHVGSPVRRLRLGLELADLPWAVRKYPELRTRLPLRILRRRSHGAIALALLGALAARRRPAAALLVGPWALASTRGVRPAAGPARLARRALEDLGEITLLAWGSVRHRTLLL